MPESMYSPSPGDWSPHPVTKRFSVQAGDVITLTLDGNFGPTTPFLRLKASK